MKAYILIFIALFCSGTIRAQLSEEEFNTIDSLIASTPEIELCLKDGKEDLRFFSRAPEKHSDYKKLFLESAIASITFNERSKFFCDIEVEINCKGESGNHIFRIEPRGFGPDDFENFKQLIEAVEKFRGHPFTPAIYLGELVNSKLKFRLAAKNGQVVLQ